MRCSQWFPQPLLFSAMLAMSSSAPGATPEHWRDVKGAALRRLFSGKEFADGVHFAYQFKANGTFSGTEMSKSVSGTWRVEGADFCWKWIRPTGMQECYRVQQDGAHVRLIVNRSEAWYGTLEPLR